MYPVAIGLMALPVLAWLWVRIFARPTELRRRTGHRELVEGGRVAVEVEVRASGGPLPSRARMAERVGDLGMREVPLRRRGHSLRGRYALDPAPRGRYRLEAAELVMDDPLGLAEARSTMDRVDTLLVYPRVVTLDGVFDDSGSAGGDAGRALLHRTAGYDLHSIREFQQGESLRRVHWRSTAKRRRLMVKELTDMPRDESAVLLDCDRSGNVGAPGHSSFDAQVRAAASLLNRMVERGQRCSLVLHQQTMRRIRIQAGGGEWGTALAALAAVRADAERPLTTMVRDALGARRRGGGRRPAVRGHRIADAGPRVAPARASVGSPRRGRGVGGRTQLRRRRADAGPRRRGVAAAGTRRRLGGPAARRRRRQGRALGGYREECRTCLSVWRVLAAIAVFSGWHWRELERPQVAVAELALLAVLATIPGLLAAIGRRRWAFASIPVVIWSAVWATFGYQPWEFDHRIYPAASRDRSSGRRPQLVRRGHAVRRRPVRADRVAGRAAFFALMAVLAWLLLEGGSRSSSVAAGFALFAIPSTALTSPDSGLQSGHLPRLALATIAVCQRQRPVRGIEFGQFAVLAAATIAVGLVVATAPGVAKGALFDWRHWNPLGGEQSRVSVAYVWDQHYGDLKWPKKRRSCSRSHLPAALLEGGHSERLRGRSLAGRPEHPAGIHGHVGDRVPPRRCRSRRRSRIIAATSSWPRSRSRASRTITCCRRASRFATTSILHEGHALHRRHGRVEHDPDRGATYTLRGYSPDPTPSQLADAGTSFPFAVASGNLLNGSSVPIWGTPGAGDPASIAEVLKNPPLRPPPRRSGALGRRQDEHQYGAVVAVEAYLRARPFAYDQTPSYRPSYPVLADFLLRSHRGYCQMFSGSMALVLRAYGIPARVAVGFTEGHQTSPGHFAIDDRDAHSWVEVYFPRYGWLPFDPTPTRNLTAQASTSTRFAKVARVGDAWVKGIPRASRCGA